MYNLSEYPDPYVLAMEFISHTGQHVFLTGKAGTGKTTLLRAIKKESKKKLVVVAPTGVAAMNAGGVTAHSFFHLPLGSFIPGSFRRSFSADTAITDRHHLIQHLKFDKEKREMLRTLELLIIDEVSMLRADMLDAIDAVLRHIRSNSREPFGGVQVLFIGDLYQLPPVVKESEWQLLRDYYQSPFFFEAMSYKEAAPIGIELMKVYRQHDETFISLLNRVRSNQMVESDFERLMQCYRPQFHPAENDRYITLTTHNHKADEINRNELKKLNEREFVCEATVSDDFPDRNFPVEKSLHLKIGAQIMFIRNDTEERKYFNGKIGIVSGMEEHDEEGDHLRITFPETNETITVKKVTWKNIRYRYNETQNAIQEEEMGSFTQFPLRLAWAVTIHKSQGLTFDRLIIDAGSAFAAGQVYVALSRCISLEGIVLMSRITPGVIMTDAAIVKFMGQQSPPESLSSILKEQRESYLLKSTLALFNLEPLIARIDEFIIYLGERKLEHKEKIIGSLHTVSADLLKLKELAEKFLDQVGRITAGGLSQTVQEQLNERVNKAKTYFEKELDEKLNEPLAKLNKQLQQQTRVRMILGEMKSIISYCDQLTDRFRAFSKKKSDDAELLGERSLDNFQTEEHLFNALKQQRRKFSEEENVPPFMICHDAALLEMVRYLPLTLNDISLIKGVGKRGSQKYGGAFMATIVDFCRLNRLASRMQEKEEEIRSAKAAKKNKPPVAGDTRAQSFELFKAGKSIDEIAAIRRLAINTIEGHLSWYVATGEIDVFHFITPEKLEQVKTALVSVTEPGLGAIKNFLEDEIDYGELRLALAFLNRQ
jgi:hypothetical protein